MLLRQLLGGTDKHVLHIERAAWFAMCFGRGSAGRSVPQPYPGFDLLDLDKKAWRETQFAEGRPRKDRVLKSALWMLVDVWLKATGGVEPSRGLTNTDALDWSAECMEAFGLLTEAEASDRIVEEIWLRMRKNRETPQTVGCPKGS